MIFILFFFSQFLFKLLAVLMIQKRGGYLRFRNIISPSGVVMYGVKPVSASLITSSLLRVALLIHSSFCSRNSACSRFMYIMVLSMSLCPRMFLTWIMSLVLWYSIVPLKCLNV